MFIWLKSHLLHKGFHSYLDVGEGVRKAGNEEEGNKGIMHAFFKMTITLEAVRVETKCLISMILF